MVLNDRKRKSENVFQLIKFVEYLSFKLIRENQFTELKRYKIDGNRNNKKNERERDDDDARQGKRERKNEKDKKEELFLPNGKYPFHRLCINYMRYFFFRFSFFLYLLLLYPLQSCNKNIFSLIFQFDRISDGCVLSLLNVITIGYQQIDPLHSST